MYEHFFGFRERPFDLTPNPRYLILTEAHREALSNLEYAISSRKGVTLLIGDAGAGKTTVIRAALERQSAQVHCVHLSNPALTRAEFVEMLAVRFGLTEKARRSKTTMLLELEKLLTTRRARDETSVLVVDEAQSLSHELLEELRLLVNIETNDEKLLSLILAGQPELAEHLNDMSLRQLKQRVALRCELRPLTLPESVAYVAGRIRAAGGTASQVFTREAVTLMYERSRGVPRTLSVLADNALVSGFATGHRPVGTAIVREVCRDFDLAEGQDDPSRRGSVSQAGPAEPRTAPAPAVPHERKVLGLESDVAPANEDVAEDPPKSLFSGFAKGGRFSFFGR